MAADPQERIVCLRPGIAVPAMPDGVQLRCGDEEIHRLRTPDAEFVARLLEEWRQPCSPRQMIARHGTDRAALVIAVFDQLERQQCWAAEESADANAQRRFFLNAARRDIAFSSLTAAVSPRGHEAFVATFRAAAAEQGFAVDGDSNSAAPLVCLVEQPDLALLTAVNQTAVAARRPCLFVDLSHGRHATVGPFYVPHEGACYQCFRVRWRQNAAAAEEMAAADEQMLRTDEPLPAFGTLPAFRTWIAGLALAELVAYFTRHRPLRTLNQATTIDLEGFRQWTEPVWRVPWCPVCGTPR